MVAKVPNTSKKLFVSWENAARLCAKLAEKINSSNFNPEILIAITRGGLVPGRIISSLLSNPRLYCIKYEYYDKDDKPTKFPQLTQTLSFDLKGKKILLIDEIADTGDTLREALKYLNSLHAEEVKTAVMHYKPHSSFHPDYSIEKTNKWIVYPWEEESIKRSSK